MPHYAYDLHIHTAASPCADEHMSPHNIIHMAQLKGLHIIAITDHQTCCNCKAVMEVGQKEGVLVIPGIEIMCQEEFHLVALLPSYKVALEAEAYIQSAMLKVPNNHKFFGEQLCFNEQDEVIGEIPHLLLMATQHSSLEVVHKIRDIGGVIYPAHIDRASYSILSQLGILPDMPKFNVLELSQHASLKSYSKMYKAHKLIQCSDAHYLQDILEVKQHLQLETLTIKAVLEALCL